MGTLSLRQWMVVAAHALMLWVLCGVLMFAGMSLVPLDYALVIHAIGAPIITILISWVYFKQFHYTTPLVTAFLFVGIVIFMATFGAGHYLSHQSGTAKAV